MVTTPEAMAAARERARRRNGQWGNQHHSDPDPFAFDDGDSWRFETGEPDPFPEPDPEPIPESAPGNEPEVADPLAAAIRTINDPGLDPAARELAVLEVGAAVSTRAEQIAGITAEQIADARARDIAEAEAWIAGEGSVRLTELAERSETARQRLQGVEHGTPEQRAALSDLDLALDNLRALRDEHNRMLAQCGGTLLGPRQRDALHRLHDGYLAALREQRDLTGEITGFTRTTTKKAREAFAEASAPFPADWVAASEAAGPMMGRVQKTRAHYSQTRGALIREPLRFVEEHDYRTTTNGDRPGHDLRVRPFPLRGRTRAGSTWVKERTNPDGTVEWRAAPLEAPREWSLRGPVPEGSRRPGGTGWEWHPSDSHPGHGHWLRVMTQAVPDPDAPPVAEIKTSPEPAVIEGRSDTFATAVHELSHRAEYTVPGVVELEHAFLDRRRKAAGREGASPARIFPGVRGNQERAIDAGFVHPYVGKVYDAKGRTPAGLPFGRTPTEVLATGMEALFGGSFGGLVGAGDKEPDLDHRDFVLGLLAAVGRDSRA